MGHLSLVCVYLCVLKLRLGVNDVGESYLMANGWTVWNIDVYK